MREEDSKTKEGAALWREARQGWHSPADPDLFDGSPDALLLAAYLDGGLAEDEAARLEARLAGEAALLDELLTLRETLQAGPEAVPAPLMTAVLARAQAAFPERPAMRVVESARPSLLDRLFGFQLRPAVSAFAAIALLLACVGAFELGRYQAAQLDTTTQTADTAESDVPAEFVLGGLL